MSQRRGPAIGAGIGPTFTRKGGGLVCPPGCSVVKAPGIVCSNRYTLDVPVPTLGTLYGGDYLGLGQAGCFNIRHAYYLQSPGDPPTGALGLTISPTWDQTVLEGPVPAQVNEVIITDGDWQSLSPPTPATVQIALVSLSCGLNVSGDFCQALLVPPVRYDLEEASGNRQDWYGYIGPDLVPNGTVTRVTGKVGFGIYTAGATNGNYLLGTGFPWNTVSAFDPRNWSMGMWVRQDNDNSFTGFGWPIWFGPTSGHTQADWLARLNWPMHADITGRAPNFQVSDGVGWVNHTLPIGGQYARGVWYAIWMTCSLGSFEWGMVSDDGTYDETASSSTTLNVSPQTFFGLHGRASDARFNGVSDNVRAWPVSLTKAQILEAIGWVAP